jgi:rhodanese-related sulfurtransferase
MKRMTILLTGMILVLAACVTGPSVRRGADAPTTANPAENPADVGPAEAARLAGESGALILDVRTQAEYVFVGHPAGAVNIPLELWDANTYQWSPNPRFEERVKARFPDQGVPLLLICRSANRSRDGAKLLAKAGYRRVYNILEGFEGDKDPKTGLRTLNGWRNRGLPTTYDLDRKLLYFP